MESQVNLYGWQGHSHIKDASAPGPWEWQGCPQSDPDEWQNLPLVQVCLGKVDIQLKLISIERTACSFLFLDNTTWDCLPIDTPTGISSPALPHSSVYNNIQYNAIKDRIPGLLLVHCHLSTRLTGSRLFCVSVVSLYPGAKVRSILKALKATLIFSLRVLIVHSK